MQAYTFVLIVLSLYAGYYTLVFLYDRMQQSGSASSNPDAGVYSFPPHVPGTHAQMNTGASREVLPKSSTYDKTYSQDTELFDYLDDTIADDGIEVTDENLHAYFKNQEGK